MQLWLTIDINLLKHFYLPIAALKWSKLCNYPIIGMSVKVLNRLFPKPRFLVQFSRRTNHQSSTSRTLLSEFTAKSIVIELQQLIWADHSETVPQYQRCST